MSYNYLTEKSKIFSESGQVDFLKVRDRVHELLDLAGAFRMDKVRTDSDLWFEMACIDRLIEIGELVELKRDCWGQYRIFSSPKVCNL